jgi:hypothetical protein
VSRDDNEDGDARHSFTDADRPRGGPDWRLRFAVTLLFPK